MVTFHVPSCWDWTKDEKDDLCAGEDSDDSGINVNVETQ